MCHDYAPGGRAYAFETTVAKERAQNVHAHDGITEDAFVARRTARDATLDTPRIFLPSRRRTAAARAKRPALFQDPDRDFNSLILSDPLPIIWVLLTSKRSRARSPTGNIVFAWTLRRDQGNKAVASWRRMSGYKSCLFAEGWPSGLRQRS